MHRVKTQSVTGVKRSIDGLPKCEAVAERIPMVRTIDRESFEPTSAPSELALMEERNGPISLVIPNRLVRRTQPSMQQIRAELADTLKARQGALQFAPSAELLETIDRRVTQLGEDMYVGGGSRFKLLLRTKTNDGADGVGWIAQDTQTDERVFVKMFKPGIAPRRALRELAALKKLKKLPPGENIVKLLDLSYAAVSDTERKLVPGGEHWYQVLEYMPHGDLYDFMTCRKVFKESRKYRMTEGSARNIWVIIIIIIIII